MENVILLPLSLFHIPLFPRVNPKPSPWEWVCTWHSSLTSDLWKQPSPTHNPDKSQDWRPLSGASQGKNVSQRMRGREGVLEIQTPLPWISVVLNLPETSLLLVRAQHAGAVSPDDHAHSLTHPTFSSCPPSDVYEPGLSSHLFFRGWCCWIYMNFDSLSPKSWHAFTWVVCLWVSDNFSETWFLPL